MVDILIPDKYYRKCSVCGKVFFNKQLKVRTCSKQCGWKLSSLVQQKRIPRICVICKNEFFLPPSLVGKRGKGDGSYCSKKCRWGRTRMKWSERQKDGARMLVWTLVKRGVLQEKACESTETCWNLPTEPHHYLGYKKIHWLDIRWLCDLHHAQEHERLRQTGESLAL